MMRKSRYLKALKVRSSKPASVSRKGLLPLDEVEDVSVDVGEEDKPVALIGIWFGKEADSLRLELLVRGVKIVDLNS